MGERVKVGMADFNICKVPDTIITLGLGSCVGVVLYDKTTKVAGMLHAMLPDSTKIRNNSNRAKFVDTGLEDLLALLEEQGVKKQNLIAKVAGGAQMFNFSANTEISGIGARNAEAARKKLQSYGIRIAAEDTGLDYGRTIEFNPENGKLEIRAVGKGITYI
ncbi:MAG: chemotaxis protein CheD [Lachnospiraceae bacterium]|nr:chemotaxis protein CheD [Lachnospiraceae bacterium]